jgi:phage repressor protein C with HTH and peptisase S24 domain
LAALAKASQVCLEWLATGEGTRQKESSKSSLIPIPVLRTPAVAGEASESSRERPHESKSGEVLLFNGQWLQEQLKCDPENVVALRVAGTRMRPTLEHGDLIIVNRADNFAVNSIGPILCAQQAAKRMSDRHNGRGGAVIARPAC